MSQTATGSRPVAPGRSTRAQPNPQSQLTARSDSRALIEYLLDLERDRGAQPTHQARGQRRRQAHLRGLGSKSSKVFLGPSQLLIRRRAEHACTALQLNRAVRCRPRHIHRKLAVLAQIHQRPTIRIAPDAYLETHSVAIKRNPPG